MTAFDHIPLSRLGKRMVIGTLALLTLASAGIGSVVAARGPVAAHAGHPVLVELYHSQGCSSCPPAEANLNAIAARRDVVALSFGVTYWDYLGWKDQTASPQFTARQQDFARYNRSGYVATPQVWIDGRTTLVGNDAHELDAAIHAANAQGPDITLTGGKAGVAAGSAPASGADVWAAQFDPRTVLVAIGRGENGGRTLPQRNVVRQLVKIGHWSGAAATYPLPPRAPGLMTAVFVQAGPGGPVLSAVRDY